MLKEEFLMFAGISDIDADAYRLIEFVYAWHPANFTKSEIADVYNMRNGMRIIESLRSDAQKAERAYTARLERNRLQAEYATACAALRKTAEEWYAQKVAELDEEYAEKFAALGIECE